jgi:hypothetical protein
MLILQHERFVEELNVQLSFKQPITSSDAIMTLGESMPVVIGTQGGC